MSGRALHGDDLGDSVPRDPRTLGAAERTREAAEGGDRRVHVEALIVLNAIIRTNQA
jgi:hypothetical protein